MSQLPKRAILLGAAILLVAGPAPADERPTLLGKSKDWRAYVVESGGNKTCFVYSEPVKEQGDYKVRGKVSVTVSHRPADKVRNEVSFVAGYTFKRDSQVDVTIDGKKFNLFVDGGAAWTPDAKTDDRLREALAAGVTMVVRGRSSRDTRTTDTYSLAGSTRALELIDEACGV